MSIYSSQAILHIVARIGLPCFCALFLNIAFLSTSAYSQSDSFDPSWINQGTTYAKLAVLEDGMYRISGTQLADAGVPLANINPASLKIFHRGQEIPLWLEGGTAAALQPSDAFIFAGSRNTGDEEAWAYNGDASLQGSTHFSLFSDTTWYWVTWDGEAGRRYADTDPNQPLNNPVAVSSFRDTLHIEEDNLYYFGDSDDAAQPEYTRGEGYFERLISHLDTAPIRETFPLNLADAAASTDSLVVTARLSSGSAPQHLVTLQLEADGVPQSCATCTAQVEWSGYAYRDLRIALPQNLVTGATTLNAVVVSDNSFNSVPNRVFIDWVEASYIRNTVLPANQLSMAFDAGGARTLRVTNQGTAPLAAFSPRDSRRFLLAQEAGNTYAFNDDASGPVTYTIVDADGFLAPADIQIRQPVDLAASPGAVDYIIITTPALTASANDLANYRQQADGYNTLIVNQYDIFDQFDYGRPTPLAIRRFVHAALDWPEPPAFVMFWGDILRPEDNRARRQLFPWEVLSFGYAPADGWFGMQKNGATDWIERPAIGRIPIRDNETGSFFVEKISNYEAGTVAAWQKRMLLLVGGQTQFEQARLRSHALSWGEHATGLPTGMDTLRFFKTASDPLDPTFQDALNDAFKDGASWVSYFGHSAADTWEIVTEAPEDYDNADRLPVVLSMGCNTGNFAGGRFELTDRLVYGERLVLASMNGAIAHWGSSSASTIDQPALLTDQLHQVVFQDTVRVLGLALIEAKRRYITSRTQTASAYNVLLQYGLIGDPATRVRIADKPEFQTAAEAIEVTPLTPVPADGNVTVETAIRNWGLLPTDSVDVQLTHISPSGNEDALSTKILPRQREEIVQFNVPIGNPDIGENTFQVSIDPVNIFEEVDELNNVASKNHTIFSAGLALISPADFALIPAIQPTLLISLATNDATARTIAFEVDTVPSFDSPALQQGEVQTTGAIASWQVDIALNDKQSYYWRARINSNDQSGVWQNGHFTVDQSVTQTGWTQQGRLFENNETDDFLQWNTDAQAWIFSEFKVDVRSTAERGAGFEKGQFIVNGTRFLGVTLGYGVLVLDGLTGQLKDYASFPTYNISEDLQERFDTDSTRAVAGLTDMLTNLETGDYLFVRTRHLGNLNGPTIQEEVKQLFRDLGSQQIDGLTYSHLWLMTTRVGFPAETMEWVEPPSSTSINEIAQDTTLFFNQSAGYTKSPLIGPASDWRTLSGTVTLPNTDSDISVNVLNPETGAILLENQQLSGSIDLSALDAVTYPYLQLEANVVDLSQASTPQLDAWTVFFEPTVELAIDPSATTFSADTLAVAQTLDIATAATNLSTRPAPLSVLTYTLTNASNEESVLARDTLRNLGPGAQYQSALQVETTDLAGTNRIRIALDQPGVTEPFLLNNVLIREFVVLTDNEEPLLEVLIDSEMLPADFQPVQNLQDPALPFVSTRPTIELTISDDGAFQLLNDTNLVQLELDDVTVHFSDPQVQFEPGTVEKNEARIVFTPDLSGRDTTHTLFARVFDPAGNEADNSPYQVHFRVQSAFEIESLYPYPNPMHTATTFAFRLRGDEAMQADDFRIRIFTLSGRLIKEFDLIEDPGLLEIPGLRIGWNKLGWDGRDADGDRVAPGVYLYKVFLSAAGESIDVNNSSSVEKIVVLR
ncbi:MAG: C25 family cysteine peptidase [Bacteroidota bacterium]